MITNTNIKGLKREGWLALRKRGVGGSDVGKVLGVSEWGTAVDVWLEKTGRSAPVEQTEAMWLGNELEASVARRYARENDVEVCHHNFMAFDDEAFLVGNIDRLVKTKGAGVPAHQGEVRTAVGLECKTSSQAPWDEVPLHYQAQVQTYMALHPSIQFFDVAAAFYGRPKAFKTFSVHRDEEVIASIRERVKEFWVKYVLGDTPPEPTCEEDCKSIWKASNPGRKVYATDVVVDAVKALKDFDARIKELEAVASEVKTSIMAAMEDGEILLGPDGAKLVSWKNNKDSTNTDWKAVAMALGAPDALVEQFTMKKPGARVFRVS